MDKRNWILDAYGYTKPDVLPDEFSGEEVLANEVVVKEITAAELAVGRISETQCS